MGIRLLFLAVVAGGLAVYFAFAQQTVSATSPGGYLGPTGSTTPPPDHEDVCRTIEEQPIGGSEPEVEPKFDVKVEVDTSGDKNRLYFTISEAHGYYVDTFRLQVWWVEEGVTGPDDSALTLEIYLNTYKKADETLRTCVEVVPAELKRVGGDIGSSKNWAVELVEYGRRRQKNPDKFPIVSDVGQCH